jgi:hypothetical protein
MSRRTKPSVRQTSRIPRFFAKHAAGVSFAYHAGRCFIAAVSCALVGGCIVTSAEEFPEEVQVPPIVLDSPGLPIGAIVRYDQRNENGVRLRINIRDANVDDELQVQAELSVVGQSALEHVCPEVPVGTTDQPDRMQFDLVIDRSKIRMGVCNKVDVYVSRDFAGNCTDNPKGIGLPQLDRKDLGHALYWIWEISGEPGQNPNAAQDITSSCETTTLVSTTSMPTNP